MPRGKPWTIEKEKQLKSLLDRGLSIRKISELLEKSPEAVRVKIKRLGLEVVDRQSADDRASTSNEILPHELISMEDSLKLLVGALKLACTPGLSKVEVQRLQVVATLSRNYHIQLPVYLKMRTVEKRLFELEGKIVEFVKRVEGNSSSN
jgi:DNA-binding transcriptional MerR regulator